MQLVSETLKPLWLNLFDFFGIMGQETSAVTFSNSETLMVELFDFSRIMGEETSAVTFRYSDGLMVEFLLLLQRLWGKLQERNYPMLVLYRSTVYMVTFQKVRIWQQTMKLTWQAPECSSHMPRPIHIGLVNYYKGWFLYFALKQRKNIGGGHI